MEKKAYHGGGGLYKAVGLTFEHIEKGNEIINADGLDAWFDPSPKALKKLGEHLSFAVKTSPPVHAEGIIAAIADHRNLLKENIVVEGGSSDLMFTLFPSLSIKRVLILDPMYGEYAHIFENVLEGVELFRYTLKPENDFALLPDEFVNQINEVKPNLVVIVNPNSPTGTFLPIETVQSILEQIPKETIFVIDETYIDYVGTEQSLEGTAATRESLIVIKSMSKMYSLSGARVGYLVAHKNFIEKIDQRIPPFQVSLPAQILAIEALKDLPYYQEKWKETNELRKEFVKALQKLPNIKVFSREGNFLLMQLLNSRAGTAQEVVDKLASTNIFVRNAKSMSKQFGENFIRIAVKDAESNKRMVEELKSLL